MKKEADAQNQPPFLFFRAGMLLTVTGIRATGTFAFGPVL